MFLAESSNPKTVEHPMLSITVRQNLATKLVVTLGYNLTQ